MNVHIEHEREMTPKPEFVEYFPKYGRIYVFWFKIRTFENTLSVTIGPKEFYSKSQTLRLNDDDILPIEIMERHCKNDPTIHYVPCRSEIVCEVSIIGMSEFEILDLCNELEESLIAVIKAVPEETYESGRPVFFLTHAPEPEPEKLDNPPEPPTLAGGPDLF